MIRRRPAPRVRPGWGLPLVLALVGAPLTARPVPAQETGAVAVPPPAAGPTPAATPVAGVRRALIIGGLPGDAEHRTLYATTTTKLAQALTERCGVRPSDVWIRFGGELPGTEGPAVPGSRGPATAAHLAADAEALRQVATPDDAVWVIVLGHGHFDGRRSHLNLPGPDLSDQAFGRLFAGLRAQEQVFWLTTSASGFFVRPLARSGRVVIAATEADQEVNETLMPLALADVLAAPLGEADRDRDGALSLFELYLAVAADVAQRYVADELIATEHAQLDDNGDGRGTEVQLVPLPPSLAPAQDQPAPKPDQKPKPAPTLRPQDDGFRAAAIRVDRPPPAPNSPPAP